ncbi:DUF4445 domain-containing protein [candidate division KSB1 bacterium]|nr:DUF4445 domain-containing protein [candidate division KSB1 bacterium]
MSPKIKIMSTQQTINVHPGENLCQALKSAGYPVDAQCGGQGTCGRCAVKIVEGNVTTTGKGLLSTRKQKEGFVLSCLAGVYADIVVDVQDAVSKNTFGQEDVPFNYSINPEPITEKVCLQVKDATGGHGQSDIERLGITAVDIPLGELCKLPDTIRAENGIVTLTRITGDNSSSIIKIESGETLHSHFGLACDIGTTTIAVRLVNLRSGLVVDTRSAYNRQIQNGADVITRIIYSQKDGHLSQLQRQAIDSVNDLIAALLNDHDISSQDITAVIFAGNTTMTHLILGINPKYIREEPYLPVVKNLPRFRAREMGLHVYPEAAVLFSPCVGSYVGGDITAGMLCTRKNSDADEIQLFIDIGTNGELVISGPDWNIGCACSAGPAFEGVGIRNGMRAAEGAICTVKMSGGDLNYSVLGAKQPCGICGSGLIELVAELFLNGIIGRDGKFNRHPRIVSVDNIPGFVVAQSDETPNNELIVLTEQDIANILRAKAAIFSAIRLLLNNLGLTFENIDRIYIAGGFGCSLNIKKAISIGLFPDLDANKFSYLGNTSLNGATLALMSQVYYKQLNEIAKSLTYIDLSSQPGYMDEYMGALFLPHTDENLFQGRYKSVQ